MKFTHVLRYFLFASTLAAPVLFPSASLAQRTVTTAVATIPFDFRIGESLHLNAGKYTLTQPLESQLFLRAGNHGGIGVVMSEQDYKPATRSHLIFHRYGNSYFLREVWIANSPDHLNMPESKAEKKIRKETLNAAIAAQQGSIELALLNESH